MVCHRREDEKQYGPKWRAVLIQKATFLPIRQPRGHFSSTSVDVEIRSSPKPQNPFEAFPEDILVKADIHHGHKEKGEVHTCEFASGTLFRLIHLPGESPRIKSKWKPHEGRLKTVESCRKSFIIFTPLPAMADAPITPMGADPVFETEPQFPCLQYSHEATPLRSQPMNTRANAMAERGYV
jgi:hypothetical protein